MIYAINNTMRVLLVLLTITLTLHAQERTFDPPIRDDAWHHTELQRAEKLIRRQHDFSPIHEAFSAKDVVLLWHYYVLSFNIEMHNFAGNGPPVSDASVAKMPMERQQRIKVNREIQSLAKDYLLKIPGHARYIGDRIEECIHGRAGGGGLRRTLFACLFSLGQDGSDECIVQIGRYLFDQRDPGFLPYDPAIPRMGIYDTRGVRNTVQRDAIGSMRAVARVRFPVGASWVDAQGLPLQGYEPKVLNWWLTSDEAAPYRRSLADSGVVLPPGYPPMKELEGSKTTIAPPLKNPPYPDEEANPTVPTKQ